MERMYDGELLHAIRMAKLAVHEAENDRQAHIGDYTKTKMIMLGMPDVRNLLEAARELADQRGLTED